MNRKSVELGKFAIAGIIVLFLASIAVNFMQMAEYKGLQTGYDSLNSTYAQDKAQWSGERRQLSAQIGQLNEQAKALQTQINGLQDSLDEQKREKQAADAALAQAMSNISAREAELAAQAARLQILRNEFAGLQLDINDSMKWFRDNSVLEPNVSWNIGIIAPRVIEDCVDGQDLNLACVNYILERMATIRYRHDPSTNTTNRFQSIAETAAMGSGDCKDYSLLLKAILNTVREKQGGLRIVAWQPGGAQRFIIYPRASLNLGPDEAYWYYPNASGVDMGQLDERHAYVICYGVTPTEGHCTVALSDVQANSSAQLPAALNGADVFEPQDGQYLGKIGSRFTLCTQDRWWECTATPNVIIVVISDNDLYKIQDGQWVGYGDYSQKVGDAMQNLSG